MSDGSDPKQLTTGTLALAPRAGTVFAHFNVPTSGWPKPWKYRSLGGDPIARGNFYFRPVEGSPDGKQLL